MGNATNPRSNQRKAESASKSGNRERPAATASEPEPSLDELFGRLEIDETELHDVAREVFVTSQRNMPRGYKPGAKAAELVTASLAIARAWFVGLAIVNGELESDAPEEAAEPETNDDDDNDNDDDQAPELADLTVGELRGLADIQKVDLTGLGKKSEIVEAIEKSLGSTDNVGELVANQIAQRSGN